MVIIAVENSGKDQTVSFGRSPFHSDRSNDSKFLALFSGWTIFLLSLMLMYIYANHHSFGLRDPGKGTQFDKQFCNLKGQFHIVFTNLLCSQDLSFLFRFVTPSSQMRNFKKAPKPLYQYKGNTTKNDLNLF